MGWKTRKDKIQSESPTAEQGGPTAPIDPSEASATGQPNAAAREPYTLDLDNDAFRTSSSHTSLDPGAFSWYQAAPINAPEEADESARPGKSSPTKPQSPMNGQNGPRAQSPAPQQPANAFEDFGTPGSAFGQPQGSPAFPSGNGPSAAQDWSLKPVESVEPLRFDSVSQFTEPPLNPAAPPAFSEPAPSESWDFGGAPAAPQSGMTPIEQLMAPKSYEAPAPDPAVGRTTPAIPDSYRPSAAQTQPQQSAPPPAPEPPIYAPSRHSRPGREDVAAGLVRQDSDLAIPRVAPFILDMGSQAEIEDPIEQPTLVIRFKNLAARYTIAKEIITLGRPDSDTGNYPDVEIEMDEGVSRKHAEIRRKGSRHYLIDLGSTNGTLLNGQAVIALTENQLTHGDRIRIGEMTEIIFE